MVPQPFSTRLSKLRHRMQEQEIDALLISSPENRFYFSGFRAEDLMLKETAGFLFITHTSQHLLTDFRYEGQASREAEGYSIEIYKESWDEILKGLLRLHDIGHLGFESQHITYQRYREMEQVFFSFKKNGRILPADGLAEEQRMIKDEDEIEKIRASILLTEKVLDSVWKNLAPGLSEREIAWRIEREIREAGAEAVSFPPIVASGPNSALPHAVPGPRRIRSGEPVIIDLGSRLDHYCSDMTRTWVSAMNDKVREIYSIVREAQRAATESIRVGRDSHEVDGIARKIIDQAGYGKAFGHGLGHGVGLAVHERPGFGKTNRVILQENMVLTVEPGIYLPGFGGVRLENMVRVTREGVEVLNRNLWFYD